VGVSWGD
jgi:hypothetical protein